MRKTFRNTFNFAKTIMKSDKSRKTKNEIKFSPQDSFLSMLNSTGNPISFAKDVDKCHIRSQYVCMPTKSQGTTNAATMKSTISPQSTNFIGSSKIIKTNKKLVTEFNSNWEDVLNATTHTKA